MYDYFVQEEWLDYTPVLFTEEKILNKQPPSEADYDLIPL